MYRLLLIIALVIPSILLAQDPPMEHSYCVNETSIYVPIAVSQSDYVIESVFENHSGIDSVLVKFIPVDILESENIFFIVCSSENSRFDQIFVVGDEGASMKKGDIVNIIRHPFFEIGSIAWILSVDQSTIDSFDSIQYIYDGK